MDAFLKLFGIGRGAGSSAIRSISVNEAHRLQRADAVLLIDVRAPDEWKATGRPQGSIGVTLQDPDFTGKILAHVSGDRSVALALTCRTGARSSSGAKKLAADGFSDLANVEGGFLAWKQAGLPVDKGPF